MSDLSETEIMPLDEALAHADEWIKGQTFYPGIQGWRPVCAVLTAAVRELQRQNDELTTVAADCRAAAGWGTPNDPMSVQSWAALGDPAEVPTFIRERFQGLQRQVAELEADARRYRWLHENLHPDHFCAYMHYPPSEALLWKRDAIDAAIDAALNKEKEG